ncbi:MAG: aldose epimerase family protein [Tateyamaria sp.]|uniref:aldose epimerase family protein n=1 Tax=Tateyamaria sp. TaxID=1929288 RepID=UPI00329C14BC
MTDQITLVSDGLRATVSPHGARLKTLSYQGSASLTLHADPSRHPTWRDVYPGAIVGPVANRVAGGRVPLNDVIHHMPCNENGITALHSGPNGLDQQMWQVVLQTSNEVHLCALLPHETGGLPGTRAINVHYKVEGATLTLSITAVTDAPTPINIAHHPYWRLGDARDHRLQIPATHYLPVNGDNIPTGQIAPVANTPFDHAHPKQLDPSVDHNFCIKTVASNVPTRLATLHGSDGLALRINSTEPGLQVYAGAHIPTLPGTDIAPFAGIALEPQGWPDAVNHPNFPPILCAPGHPYRQITQYCIGRDT